MIYFMILTSLIVAGAAQAQTAWPERPVTVVVPFPAGSATDLVARVITKDVAGRLGQPFIIENRPGADGTIGVRQAVRSAPDGYTLSFGGPGPYAAAPYVYTKLAYDPVKDLAPVSLVGRTPYAFAVYPGLGVKNVLDFVARAKANPGALNFSSIGDSSISHLGMVVFAEKMGLQLHHVPYKSTSQSIIDVVAGIIHAQLATIPPIVSLYETRKIQILAITGKNRLPLLKDVPTMSEEGISDYEQTFWLAMFAPAGTPADIVGKLNKAVGAALQTEEVRQAFIQQGIETEYSTPEELGAILRRDIDAYREVASRAGIARR